jgi:SSS family solute:Na+ symporter
MGQVSSFHIIGSIITLSLIIFTGIYTGRKVKDAKDFSTGGYNAGAALVSGTIIGTLVGGSSTIGTAQLAFTNGLSAWWFTLGKG